MTSKRVIDENVARGARWMAVAGLIPILVACGGSGGGGLGTGGLSFIEWRGNNNGAVVLAADNFQVRFTTDSYLYYGDTQYTNVVVVDGKVLLNGVPLAIIALSPANGGGQVAVMQCLNSTQLVKISGSTLTCPSGSGSGGGGTGGGNSSGGNSSDSGSNNGGAGAPAPIQCGAGYGNGTNGLRFYNPSGYTSYQISTTAAGASSLNSLSWGVAYENVMNLAAGSYSGSLRARLWAVSSSYRGGTINGVVLGTFVPNFSGAGARNSNQVYVGGYSTAQVVSSGQTTNPAYGSYCIVATLEQYSGNGYYIVDWVQFSDSLAFR